MSSSPAPRSPGPSASGSTRQLLDELDALMQRMLELPVNQLDDDPTPPTNTVLAPTTTAPPAAEETPSDGDGQAARPSLAEPSRAPDGELAPVRRVIAHPPTSFPTEPHRVEEPSARTETSALPAPAKAPSARPADSAGRGAAPPAHGSAPPWRHRATGAVRGRGTRWLLGCNRAFECCTSWMGGPGRWLRGPAGRTTLGWVGLALWTVALTLGLLRLLG